MATIRRPGLGLVGGVGFSLLVFSGAAQAGLWEGFFEMEPAALALGGGLPPPGEGSQPCFASPTTLADGPPRAWSVEQRTEAPLSWWQAEQPIGFLDVSKRRYQVIGPLRGRATPSGSCVERAGFWVAWEDAETQGAWRGPEQETDLLNRSQALELAVGGRCAPRLRLGLGHRAAWVRPRAETAWLEALPSSGGRAVVRGPYRQHRTFGEIAAQEKRFAWGGRLGFNRTPFHVCAPVAGYDATFDLTSAGHSWEGWITAPLNSRLVATGSFGQGDGKGRRGVSAGGFRHGTLRHGWSQTTARLFLSGAVSRHRQVWVNLYRLTQSWALAGSATAFPPPLDSFFGSRYTLAGHLRLRSVGGSVGLEQQVSPHARLRFGLHVRSMRVDSGYVLRRAEFPGAPEEVDEQGRGAGRVRLYLAALGWQQQGGAVRWDYSVARLFGESDRALRQLISPPKPPGVPRTRTGVGLTHVLKMTVPF